MFITIQVSNSYFSNYLIIKKKVFLVINYKAAKKKIYIYIYPDLSLNKKTYKAAKVKTVSLGFTVSFLR